MNRVSVNALIPARIAAQVAGELSPTLVIIPEPTIANALGRISGSGRLVGLMPDVLDGFAVDEGPIMVLSLPSD